MEKCREMWDESIFEKTVFVGQKIVGIHFGGQQKIFLKNTKKLLFIFSMQKYTRKSHFRKNHSILGAIWRDEAKGQYKSINPETIEGNSK